MYQPEVVTDADALTELRKIEQRLRSVEHGLELTDLKLKTGMAQVHTAVLRDIMNGLFYVWVVGVVVAVLGRVSGAW